MIKFIGYQSAVSAGQSAKELGDMIRENWPQLLNYLNINKNREPFLFRLFQLLTIDEILEVYTAVSVNQNTLQFDESKKMLAVLLNSRDRLFNQQTRLSLAASLLPVSLNKSDQNFLTQWIKEVSRILPPYIVADFHDFISSITSQAQPSLTMTKQVSSGNTPGEDQRNRPLSDADEADKRQQLTDNKQFATINRAPTDQPEPVIEAPSDEGYSDFSGPAPITEPITMQDQTNGFMLKVPYAGLVLLHPFLYWFFINTRIIPEAKKDIPDNDLPRAAALLHFLATGSNEIYEFEPGFIKILLGLDPDDTLLVAGGMLNEKDKEEADNLLQSVIHHWTILKNTSTDGIRTTFLQRHGLMKRTEDCWVVQVETSSFDILINHLPWSFSTIRLPWMKKAIITEWPTP